MRLRKRYPLDGVLIGVPYTRGIQTFREPTSIILLRPFVCLSVFLTAHFHLYAVELNSICYIIKTLIRSLQCGIDVLRWFITL